MELAFASVRGTSNSNNAVRESGLSYTVRQLSAGSRRFSGWANTPSECG